MALRATFPRSHEEVVAVTGAEGIPGEDIPGGEGIESGGVGLQQLAEMIVGDRLHPPSKFLLEGDRFA
jgi:hypothetical protein